MCDLSREVVFGSPGMFSIYSTVCGVATEERSSVCSCTMPFDDVVIRLLQRSLSFMVDSRSIERGQELTFRW